MNDKRPREYAEEIGKAMRERFAELIKDVPPEFREMVTNYVINGMAIGLAKSKRGK